MTFKFCPHCGERLPEAPAAPVVPQLPVAPVQPVIPWTPPLTSPRPPWLPEIICKS